VLSIFSVAMFFGSYLAGCLPLMFSLSVSVNRGVRIRLLSCTYQAMNITVGYLQPSRLQLVTALGAGLLVGTALTVIIPEGMDSIMEEGELMCFITHGCSIKIDNGGA